MSSYVSAVQSAVFYFLACTPCLQMRADKKAKAKAKRERQEKLQLEKEQPDLYHHPLPRNTNKFWQEDIEMGPRLPKKSVPRNGSQRALVSSGKDSAISNLSGTTQGGDLGHFGPPAPASTTGSTSSGLDWNRKRYQREDEELWGHTYPGHRLVDDAVKALSSAGRRLEAMVGILERQPVNDQEEQEEQQQEQPQQSQQSQQPPPEKSEPQPQPQQPDARQRTQRLQLPPRNPPVNDYHPPVARSTPAHRDALKWMVQPPPPAKFMEGKVPVTRTLTWRSTASVSVDSQKASRSEEHTLTASTTLPTATTTTRVSHSHHVDTNLSDLSEAELIESVIGSVSRHSRSPRKRSGTNESANSSSDSEVELNRRPRASRSLTSPPLSRPHSDSGAESTDDENTPPRTRQRRPKNRGHASSQRREPQPSDTSETPRSKLGVAQIEAKKHASQPAETTVEDPAGRSLVTSVEITRPTMTGTAH